MSDGSSATVIAALLGAGTAALFQYVVAVHRSRRDRQAVLHAIVAEVGVLAELIRVQYRPDGLSKLGLAIARDPKAQVFPIDPGGAYFTVYRGLGARVGYLKQDHAGTVVQFYTIYQVANALASPDDRTTCIDDAVIDLLLKLAQEIEGFVPASVRLARLGSGAAA